MSDDDGDRHKVGYKRPPKETQFKKGHSGNPNGRPKRAANIAAACGRVLNQPFRVVKGGKQVVMTGLDILIEAQFTRATKGDRKSAELLVKLFKETEESASPAIDWPEPLELVHL